MFAVLKTGGKQHKVSSGDMLRVEKIAADAGEKVQFNDILMLGGDAPVIGAPFVAGAAVQAVDLVMSHKLTAAFCATRPPGHHAGRNKAMGFCLFNNVAIAAST